MKRDEGWAAFNIERPPESFDVALQGLVDYRPPRTVVSGEVLDAGFAKCQVVFREVSESSALRAPGVTCLHVNVLSWLSAEGEHEIERQVEIDFEFARQLQFALRLFKAEPVWLVPWGERERFNLRATPRSRYTLSQVERQSFQEFAARLARFQLDRHAFTLARRSYGVPETDILDDVELRRVFVGNHPVDGKWLARRAYLMLAADLFERAYREWDLSTDLRLVLLMTAAESLFVDGTRSEIAYRLSHRIAALNGADADSRKRLFEKTRSLYDTRSQLVHGATFSRKKGFVRADEASLDFLGNAVRASLLYFVALESSTSDTVRDGVLQRLDAAVFDPREIDDVRITANEFWGLGHVPHECLYASRWEK